MYSEVPLAVYTPDAVSLELAESILACFCPGDIAADQQGWAL